MIIDTGRNQKIVYKIMLEEAKKYTEPDVSQYKNRGNVPVLITSSSRFLPLKYQMESFIEKVKLNGNFVFYLNEDVVSERKKESKELVSWAKKSNLFKEIFVNDPNKGRGLALNRMKKYAEGYKYIFYLEDDWEFMKYINVNSIMDMMDNNEKINQIGFHNRHLHSIQTNFEFDYEYKEFLVDGHNLILAERWGYSPSIWRNSFILPHWNFPDKKAGKHIQKKFWSIFEKHKNISLESYHNFLENNVGAYYYGKLPSECDKYEFVNNVSVRIWAEAYTFHLCPSIHNDREKL